MSISVVIPIYNVENYIRQCLESVLAQTFIPLEILLVNDGTPDKSMEVIADLIDQHGQIKVIHKENGGLSEARNVGLALSKGEYVAFLDSDDYWAPNFLEVMHKNAQQFDLDVVCGSNTRVFEYGKQEIMKRDDALLGKLQAGSEFLLAQLQANDYKMEVWDDLYRTAFLKENNLEFAVGLLHEDEEFTPRMLLKAKRVMAIANYGYMYRQRENSIMSSGVSERTIIALEKILQEYMELFDLVQNKTEKEALSWLLLHLGEQYIDRLNMSKLTNRNGFYSRLEIQKFMTRLQYASQMNRKQKIKFTALSLHPRIFEAVADLQKSLKGGT
ncbi:MAG: glycosyltransferase [Turicibacter sp.]|nr:glycosyltransferase [Turicibacter sp.]